MRTILSFTPSETCIFIGVVIAVMHLLLRNIAPYYSAPLRCNLASGLRFSCQITCIAEEVLQAAAVYGAAILSTIICWNYIYKRPEWRELLARFQFELYSLQRSENNFELQLQLTHGYHRLHAEAPQDLSQHDFFLQLCEPLACSDGRKHGTLKQSFM